MRTSEDARDNPQPGDKYVFTDNTVSMYDEVMEVLPDGNLHVRLHRKYGDRDAVFGLDGWTFGNDGCWVPA